MTTIDELERRVSALERASKTEDHIIRAVAEIVAKSEKRTGDRLDSLGAEVAGLRTEITRVDARITTEVSAAKKEMIGTMNANHDAVMAAIDRLANPPR